MERCRSSQASSCIAKREIRPKRWSNLAFWEQLDDVVFTAEYSLRNAATPAYSLFEIRPLPDVYKDNLTLEFYWKRSKRFTISPSQKTDSGGILLSIESTTWCSELT